MDEQARDGQVAQVGIGEAARKVLVIEGSPRRGGNSDTLSDAFARGAREAGHAVEKVYLRDLAIGYCADCEACRTRDGGCVRHDDFQGLRDRVLAADVLAFVSPVYFYSVTAQLKTFFDRMYSAHGALAGKACYFITTGAAPDERYFQTAIDTYHGFIRCFPDMEDRGVIIGCNAQAKGAIAGNPALDEAYRAGRSV